MKLEPFDSNIGIDFRSILKNNNFITPNILGYIQTNKGIAEISKGSKFLNLEMFGVTLVNGNKRCIKLDKNFNSIEDVQKYVKELNYEDTSQLVLLLNNL